MAPERAEWTLTPIPDRDQARTRDSEEYLTGPRYRASLSAVGRDVPSVDVVVEMRMPRAYVAKLRRAVELPGTDPERILDLLYGDAGEALARRLIMRTDMQDLQRPSGDVLDLWLDGSDIAFLSQHLRDKDRP